MVLWFTMQSEFPNILASCMQDTGHWTGHNFYEQCDAEVCSTLSRTRQLFYGLIL